MNTNRFSNKLDQIILGFDFGTKYIGVAVGQTTTNTARPLECLKNNNHKINWPHIDQLIDFWKPKQLIVGIPLDMNGKKQRTTDQCLYFLQQLQQRYHLPTHKVDERLSTWEAKKNLGFIKKSHPSTKELLEINATAAALLVEQWLNENNI